MSDPLSVFIAALEAATIPRPKSPPRVSSKLERFTPTGDHQDNGWYALYPTIDGVVVGAFGCWKRQIKQKFCSAEKSSLTKDQWNAVTKAWQAAEEARRAEEQANHARVREKCKTIFGSEAEKVLTHPYLQKKGVNAYGPLRLSKENLTPGWLAMPLIDESGTIHSAEYIADDGTKRTEYQGRAQGCWFQLAMMPDGPIVIVEGYATGASVHQATGWSTVCARNAGNLQAVSTALRKLHPDRAIIFAADNDQFTDGNPGLSKATAAAKPVSGTLVYPQFNAELLFDKPTDFNDLHQISGLSEVKQQILAGTKMGNDWSLLLEDAADTMTEVIPDPVELVEGLVCEEAKMVIGGSSKTYKTWFTMTLGLALGFGGKFLGRQCRQSRVLYVNLELKARTFKRRIQTIAAAAGFKFDYKQFKHLNLKGKIAGLSVVEIVNRIVKIAKEHKSKVIILDPLYKLNTQGSDENSAGEQTVFLNQIDRLLSETGATVIFDDHFSKGNQSDKDPLDAIRGSSVKGGDVDAAVIIRAHKEKGSFTVSVVHRELAPVDDFCITWQFPLFQLNDALDPAAMKQPRKGGRPPVTDPIDILAAFKGTSSENGTTIAALARQSSIPRTTIQDHLPFLRAKNWIATSGEGSRATQHITPAGIQKLKENDL